MDDSAIFKLVSVIERKLDEKELKIRFIDEKIIEIEIGENKLRIKRETEEENDSVAFRSIYRASVINKDDIVIESKKFEGEVNVYMDEVDLGKKQNIKQNAYDKIFISIFIKARKMCYKTDSIIADMLKELE